MEKKVRTICFDCHSKCGVILTVEDGKIKHVAGDPNHPVSEGILCLKAFSAKEINEHPDRLKSPLRRVGERGEGKWKEITWDEALDEIEAKMREVIEKYGSQAIILTQGTGRGSNHWLDRLNNSWDGGGKVWITHVCLLPNLAQTHVTWGRMFHPHEACDYRNDGCITLLGTNPIRSRQYSGLRILDAKRNGSKLITVDPVFRDIAAKSDLWVPVRPGTDGVLAMCMANLVFQNRYHEAAFPMLKKWTNAPFLIVADEQEMLRENQVDPMAGADGDEHYVAWDAKAGEPVFWYPETKSWSKEDFDTNDLAIEGSYTVKCADGNEYVFKTAMEQYKEEVSVWTPEKASEICWAPVEKLLRMYDIMTNPTDGKPSILTAYLGACMMTTNALQNGRAITLLQMLLNPPIDDKGGIYFNTFWEFMLDPKITAYDKVPHRSRIGFTHHPMYTEVYGRGNIPGQLFRAIINNKVPDGEESLPVPRILLSVANDPLGSFEDTKLVREALLSENLLFNVNMDYFMTPGAELADIVLPAAHWSERTGVFDEELYPDPCPFIIPQIAVNPPGEAKDDWFFIRELGRRFNPELWPWQSSEEMQLWRLREFHGVERTYEDAAKEGYIIVYGGEHRITRQHEKGVVHYPSELGTRDVLVEFKTPTAKIEFYSEQMPAYGYNSPLPSHTEPFESPFSTPELYKEYDFCLTTGGRDYPFYHSAWTNIARQRIIEPWPYVEINYWDAKDRQISDGEWVWVESLRGKIRAKARVSKGVCRGAACMARPNYKHACAELNLPGFDWYGANPNILIPSNPEAADVGFGCSPMRSSLCKITKFEG
ncbi:MAG: molybdopterin-dependent oxidoreductase [Coriobacteriales bacterium]|jgi:anaerobic selenocysteine-containing dehydrogenase|nr:molybdopterin-dependent oxidoreductase [Coriobacteriales bacterium]